MSDRRLVDAHHHVWDLDRHPQPWLDEPGHAAIRHTFGIDDLRAAATGAIRGRGLASTVVVQSIASVEETADLLALAEREELVAAVVGWVALDSPGVGEQLEMLRDAPGGRHLRAVRSLVQGESDPGWLQRPEVERGLRAVAELDLGFDILIRSHQFPQAISLAERNPELRLVLDHVGKPPIADGDLDEWNWSIRRLAQYPNMVCKVSGLVTEAEHERWSIDDLRPVWEAVLAAFGPQRLMFGSDWPVCTLAGTWNEWAGTVEKLLAELSEPEVHAVLAGTATDFYALRAPDSQDVSSERTLTSR